MGKPERFRRYYARWAKIAFRHSFGRSDAIAGLLGMLFPAIAQALGRPEIAVSALAWQIPLGCMVGIFVLRLLLAPFWMHQEQESTIAALTTAVDELKDEREQLLLLDGFHTQIVQPKRTSLAGISVTYVDRLEIAPIFRSRSKQDLSCEMSNMFASCGAEQAQTGLMEFKAFADEKPFRFNGIWLDIGEYSPDRPIEVVFKFTLKYDTIPATRQRTWDGRYTIVLLISQRASFLGCNSATSRSSLDSRQKSG